MSFAWACSNEGSERRRRASGRPRITNKRQERCLRRLASVNPFETTQSVGATWRVEKKVASVVSLDQSVMKRKQSYTARSQRS
jgi:hypothetical protein